MITFPSNPCPDNNYRKDAVLWNSSLGRRKFLKRSGAVAAGTLIGLKGTLQVSAITSYGSGPLWYYANTWQHEISRHGTEQEAITAAEVWSGINETSDTLFSMTGAWEVHDPAAHDSSNTIYTIFSDPRAVQKINLWTGKWEWAAVVTAVGAKYVRLPDPHDP